MSEMQPPTGDYTGLVALVAALSANVTALFKGRGLTRHSVNNTINAAVGPVATRVTKLEAHYPEIDRRLGAIEQSQVRMAERLDRVLDRDR